MSWVSITQNGRLLTNAGLEIWVKCSIRLFPSTPTSDLLEPVNRVPPTAYCGHVAGGGSLAGVDPSSPGRGIPGFSGPRNLHL